MKIERIFVGSLLLILSAFAFQGESALAGVPNDVHLVATGSASFITITIDLNIGGELPAEWVGWVVDRKTIGDCDDPVLRLTDLTPFPDGSMFYTFTDASAALGTTYYYRIYAIDAEGARHYLPSYTLFPPGYYQLAYASRNNNGVIAEGRMIEDGGWLKIDACQNNCWTYLAFISGAPAELADLAGSEDTVRIRGRISAEFEGPYISQVTGWSIIPNCGSVPSVKKNWDGIKAMYR